MKSRPRPDLPLDEPQPDHNETLDLLDFIPGFPGEFASRLIDAFREINKVCPKYYHGWVPRKSK